MIMFFLCVKVFFTRIIDVSLGTFRTIITVKNKPLYASIIGFFEVFIWFMVVREALNTSTNNIFIAVSYSLGFATGTYIGTIISDYLIKANFSIEIITSNDNLVNILRNHNYAVTVLNAKGKDEDNDKYLLMVETSNKHLSEVKSLIKEHDNQAFTIITETKYVQNGYFK